MNAAPPAPAPGPAPGPQAIVAHRTLLGPGAAPDPILRAGCIALAGTAPEPNVFHDPALAAAAAALVGPVTLHWLEAGGAVLATLPVMRARLGFGVAGRLPQVLAHRQGPLGTPLLAPGLPPAPLADLLRRASEDAPALVLPFLPLQGPTAMAIRQAAASAGARIRLFRRHTRAALTGPADPDAYLTAHIAGGRRKEWGRLRRRLTEQGTLRVVSATAPDEIGPALDAFLALEASGWKGGRGALASDPAGLAFARAAVAALADRGGIRIDRLTLDGRTVAGLVSLMAGNRIWTWKTAYDESLARFSPGTLMMLEATRRILTDPGLATADSLAVPGHPMIEPIWAGRMEVGTLVIFWRDAPLFERLVAADVALHDRARTVARRLLRR